MWADEEKMQKMIRKIPKDVKICDVARSKFVWQDALDFWTITQFFLLHIIDMQGLEMSGVWELRFWHFAGPFRLDPVQRTEPSVFEAVLKLFWNLKLQSILALGQLRPSHHTIWNCSQHWEDHAPNQAGNLPAPQDPRWYHSCSTRVSDAVLQILRLDHCNPLHTIALLGDHLSYCVFRCIEMLAGCFRMFQVRCQPPLLQFRNVSLPRWNEIRRQMSGAAQLVLPMLLMHIMWRMAEQSNTKICREASNTAYACKTAKLRQSWHLWVTPFEMRYTTKRNSQKCRVSVPWGVRRADNLTLGHTSLHLETMYCTYFYHLLSTFLWKHHPRQPLALRPQWICHVKMWEDWEVRHWFLTLKSCSPKRQARKCTASACCVNHLLQTYGIRNIFREKNESTVARYQDVPHWTLVCDFDIFDKKRFPSNPEHTEWKKVFSKWVVALWQWDFLAIAWHRHDIVFMAGSVEKLLTGRSALDCPWKSSKLLVTD